MADWSNIYGIGRGSAQVWGANPALEQLERQNYEEQKRREKENAELNAEMQRVNYDGARQEDIPVLIEGFNDVKKTFAELRNARNAQERIQLASQFADKKAKFTQMVGASKAAIKGIGEIDKLRLTKADELADDFGDRLKTLKGTSTFDKEFQTRIEQLTNNAFRPEFDEAKYAADRAKMFVSKVPESAIQTRTIPGIGKQAFTTSGDKLNKEAFAKAIITDAVDNKGLQYTIKKTFPDMPISQATVLYANQLADIASQQYGVKEKVVMSKSERDNSMTEYQRRSLALREAGAGSSGGGADVPQDLVLYYGKGGKESVTGKGVVKIAKPSQSFQGSRIYDLYNNKYVDIKEAASKFEIATLGNYPVAKERLRLPNGDIIEKGGLVGDNFAKGRPDLVKWEPKLLVTADGIDYLADPKYMPKNRLTKKDEGIISTFKPIANKPTESKPSKPQPSGKKTIKGF